MQLAGLGEREKGRLAEKFSYPLIPRTSTVLDVVVLNLRVLAQKVWQVPKPTRARKNKWNGLRMAKLKGIFNLVLSIMRFSFNDYKINFNSTVIWSQFSTVSVFFSNLSQVMSKVYMSELIFYLSQTIGHRFFPFEVDSVGKTWEMPLRTSSLFSKKKNRVYFFFAECSSERLLYSWTDAQSMTYS